MEASDLYGLPLDRFVPERTAQAKALRGQGQRDQAARVAKLAKPSVAAWAVNQLVRTQRRAVDELFAAGDALQSAQQDVLAGRSSAAALREAVERERTAASELLGAARGLLSSEGQSLTQATLERVSDTLHAAALDEDARREVRDGCLTRELRHVGLGGGLATGQPATGELPARPRARARPASAGTRAKDKAGSDRRREVAERQKEEAVAQEREQRRKAARADAATARRALEAAERNLRTAEQRQGRAAAALRDADEAVSAAESRVEEASRAYHDAQKVIDQI